MLFIAVDDIIEYLPYSFLFYENCHKSEKIGMFKHYTRTIIL